MEWLIMVRLGSGFGVLLWVALAAGSGLAQQIIPDATLGPQSSQVFTIGATDLIGGGVENDINLFHSFEQFGIAPGRTAAFVSESPLIANMFARVTGAARSEIYGTLSTVGLLNGNVAPVDVNFFLLNPNGILFGPGAQLNVGTATRGAFFAVTADEDTMSGRTGVKLQPAAIQEASAWQTNASGHVRLIARATRFSVTWPSLCHS